MAARKCEICGAGMPADMMEGLCPKCILKQAMAEPEGDSGGDELDSEAEHSASLDAQSPPLMRIRYVGDYELLEELGHGGMGVVWRARQVSLDRLVAVKMIRTGELASEEEIKRFHTEAEADEVRALPHRDHGGKTEANRRALTFL